MANKKPLDVGDIVLRFVLAVMAVVVLSQYVAIPKFAQDLGIVAFVVCVPCLIGYLLTKQSGWRLLSSRYPACPPLSGTWVTCPSAVMATEALDGPTHKQHQLRLNSILRVGDDDQALYVSALWVFAPLFPAMRIPWSAIARVRYFDPSGWYSNPRRAGLAFQITYDPGFTGQFVEIQVSEPTVFLELPVKLLPKAVTHFPAPPPAAQTGIPG